VSEFVFLNWFLCIGTALLLGLVIWRYRFLLIKPSIIVIVFFHLQVQWAAAAQASYIEQYLPRPYDFLLLSQVFPLLGLLVSFFILHQKNHRLYTKLTRVSLDSLEIKTRPLVILFSGITLIVLIYLAFVPLAQTGVYRILVDPLASADARESSLKLLDNELLRYGFALLKTALAPLLSVLAIFYFLQNMKQLKLLRGTAALVIFLLTLMAVMLPGARMPGGIVILTVIFALFIFYHMPLRFSYVFLTLVLILGLAALITLLREGQDLSLLLFLDKLKGGIFERVFVVPMETGLWHAHYAQELGFVGIAGIPKLAEVVGLDPINLSNVIYIKYTKYFIYSGLSNTCFVFSYYTCFGIGSLVFSLLGLWALDLAVLVFEKLRHHAILLAAVAAVATSSIGFAYTVYTTALLTNGFLFILIIAFLLDRLADFSLVAKHRFREMEKTVP
jgi:hypothetical protein